ncbi:MAG: hypothetical protein V4733_11735 [Verrucomicrobiota bacterium]
MKRVLLYSAIPLVLGAFLFWWFSAAQVVKRRTAKLLEIATVVEGDGGDRVAGPYALNKLLAPEVTLSISEVEEANGTFDRQEIESAYSVLRGHVTSSRFDHDSRIETSVSGNTATARVDLKARVEMSGHRVVLNGPRHAVFSWINDDGWRLTAMEIAEP